MPIDGPSSRSRSAARRRQRGSRDQSRSRSRGPVKRSRSGSHVRRRADQDRSPPRTRGPSKLSHSRSPGPSKRRRADQDRSRSRSRQSSPIIKRSEKQSESAPKDTAEGVTATFEIVDGVPKDGSATWRAEVQLPREAKGRFAGMPPGFLTIRGPSRVNKDDAMDDGEKLIEAAREHGTDGCRKLQKQLNAGRLTSTHEPREPMRHRDRSRSRS